jgi:hypothetical protein
VEDWKEKQVDPINSIKQWEKVLQNKHKKDEVLKFGKQLPPAAFTDV